MVDCQHAFEVCKHNEIISTQPLYYMNTTRIIYKNSDVCTGIWQWRGRGRHIPITLSEVVLRGRHGSLKCCAVVGSGKALEGARSEPLKHKIEAVHLLEDI